MEQKNEVIDMTVAGLALVSGFNGFHHLKLSLAREVAEESGKAIQVSNDISRQDIGQSLQNILANEVAKLTQTVSMIEPENLEKILSLIQNAGMVQLVAVGNTTPVALDGAFKFNQLGIPAVSGTIWESQMAYTYNLYSPLALAADYHIITATREKMIPMIISVVMKLLLQTIKCNCSKSCE